MVSERLRNVVRFYRWLLLAYLNFEMTLIFDNSLDQDSNHMLVWAQSSSSLSWRKDTDWRNLLDVQMQCKGQVIFYCLRKVGHTSPDFVHACCWISRNNLVFCQFHNSFVLQQNCCYPTDTFSCCVRMEWISFRSSSRYFKSSLSCLQNGENAISKCDVVAKFRNYVFFLWTQTALIEYVVVIIPF